jgi:uncharacterized protein Usg
MIDNGGLINMAGLVSPEFKQQIAGYGLVTANILYRLPDYPAILQSFLWQQYDIHPEFPGLKRFLDFWQHSLDGPIHSVTVAHQSLIGPVELKAIDAEFPLH